MCDKCADLDLKIQNYQQLAETLADQRDQFFLASIAKSEAVNL